MHFKDLPKHLECAVQKHITNGIYRSTGLAFTWGLEKELAFSICWPVPIHQAEADREAGKCEARAFDPGCT
jgi:hypothetical protein